MLNIRGSGLARRLGLTVAGAVVVLVSVAGSSQAGLTPVSSRATLGGNDSLDWGTLRAAPSDVSNPVTIISSGGLPVTASEPLPEPLPFGFVFQRLDQNNGWGGNFAPADHLLYTGGPYGPITLDFASPVMGVGTQVQEDRQFGAFNGLLEVFDSANDLLGSFNFSGVSNDAADNSAVFVGVRSDMADIKKVVYDVFDSEIKHNFSINQVDIVTGPAPSTTPEPSSLVLLFTSGGLLLLGLRRPRPSAE